MSAQAIQAPTLSPAAPAAPVASPSLASLAGEPLPYFKTFPHPRSWWFMMIGLGCIMLVGAYAYLQQFQRGLIVTDLRTIGAGGSAWGVYVMFDVYFVGVSLSGIVVAALIRLFHIEHLKPLGRLAELVTVIALCLSGCSIVADLGRPFEGLINIPAFGRPASPFFGTFSSITGGYFFASIVFFFLASRPDAALCAEHRPRWAWAYRLMAMGFRGHKAEFHRHHQVSFWMALVILCLLVVEQSTLGFVFGILAGQPGWFSALKAPGFMVLAGASGIGMLILLGVFLRKYLNLYHLIKDRAFFWLANFMWIMVLICLYFLAVEELTTNYAGSTAASAVSQEITSGAYGPAFWTTIVFFALPLGFLFIQFLRRQVWIPGLIVSCILVNAAVIIDRFLLVVPSQTQGTLLAYPSGFYSPTWNEYAFVAALFAGGLFAILLYIRLFPIVPVLEEAPPEPTPAPAPVNDRIVLRYSLFALTLVIGLTIAAVGLVGSFRLGTKSTGDPTFSFAPAIFIAGLGVTLLSAVVYEITPVGRQFQPTAPPDSPTPPPLLPAAQPLTAAPAPTAATPAQPPTIPPQ